MWLILLMIGLLFNHFYAQRESHLVDSTCVDESSHAWDYIGTHKETYDCGKAVDGITCYVTQLGYKVSKLFLGTFISTSNGTARHGAMIIS